MPASLKSLPLVLCLTVAGGCAARRCQPCCPGEQPAAQVPCKLVEPGPLVPDISRLPPTTDLPAGPVQYCGLSETTAQCLAARNSSRANLLVQEAVAVAAEGPGRSGSGLAEQILRLQAVQQRNEDAAAAVELLIRLAEAEGGAHNLELRLAQVEGMLADVAHLQGQGVAAPVSRTQLEQQRLELLHRQAGLQGTLVELNHRLAEAMGVELVPGTRYWPEIDLQVDPVVADEDVAVQLALGNRADLRALHLAAQADGREALAAARIILQPLGMGAAASSPGCLAKLAMLCSLNEQADIRSNQLQQALQTQSRSVELSVRQAMGKIHSSMQQLSLTRDRQQHIQQQLAALERRAELGSGSPPDLRNERLMLLAADQDLLHDVVEWKLATLRLRAAQGLLATECGWASGAGCP